MAKNSGVSGYAGKIKHTGTQEVKAIYPSGGGGKHSKVITGKDLRTGKGK